MSVQSQENNMRRLAELLGTDLSYIFGERESGPNGAKKTFLNVGKAFLRALAKDLELREVKVWSNAAGIACSGECLLMGMWEDNGIYICMEQPSFMGENVLLYRTIRNIRDYKGGYNHYVRRAELAGLRYPQLLAILRGVRRDAEYERAA